ncbi:MAG: ATP-binding cassette domain-containing protein [Bacteroidales bacterium]|nr:ATP-binding cassette domain-containing protein [Bacteroidales bacterium]
MIMLQANHISKSFDNHKALDDVSIQVPEQSIFGLLGPNGAGKTTLIRIINMIAVKDKGEILLNGKPMQPSDATLIGYLPEERGLYKKMKVGEQAVYLARLKGMSKHDATMKLKTWFQKFEIDSWWNKKVEELSKGMQQKVQFIVTVLHQPKLLIFDEPFSGFDPINVNLLKSEIINLKKEGSTIIFSTHNMASVEEICDQITLIHQSKNILSGEIHDIKQKYKSNTFEVEYKSSKELLLPEDLFNIVSTQKTNHHLITQVKISKDASSNLLLQHLIKQAEIIKFQELLPSLNDIFIQEVSPK